jgi:hypothetical protein
MRGPASGLPSRRPELLFPRSVPTAPLLISLVLFATLALFLRFPPLYDVTTTPAAPPRYPAKPPGDVAYPERYAGLQRKAYPDLKPAVFGESVSSTFRRAHDRALEMEGWEVVFTDEEAGVFQVVAQTPLFRFRDDVVIEVREGENGSEVHVRSRSRLGKADFGTNARRIRAYLAGLE